jgi:hypothetical protein
VQLDPSLMEIALGYWLPLFGLLIGLWLAGLVITRLARR